MPMFDDFNKTESLKNLIEGINPEDQAIEMKPLDPEHFKAYVKNPSKINEDVMVMLGDLIDGRLNMHPRKNIEQNPAGPSTLDRILNSIAIVYITDDDIPVGVITLVDPTTTSYQGIKPVETYSQYSGENLYGRVQQEFFVISDEYVNTMVPIELCAQMRKELHDIPVFAIVDDYDKSTIRNLAMNNYEYKGTLNVDINDAPVQLWINRTENDQQIQAQPEMN